jgi:signal transduction histidine kinase
MQTLLDEILNLSRSGRVIEQPEVLSFVSLVNDALAMVSGQIEEHEIQVNVESDLPNVQGDQNRLVQVLQNLFDNAIKFMGSQTEPRIEIGQRAGDTDGKAIFFVKDNGIGIAPEHRGSVFDLFHKLDRDSKGTGIGLATVKRIIEAHGGRIWVESEAGKGATFCFSLPKV